MLRRLHSSRSSQIVSPLLNLIFPPFCAQCHHHPIQPQDPSGYLCPSCYLQWPFIHAPFCQNCAQPFSGALSNTFTCTYCHTVKWSFDWARAGLAANPEIMRWIYRFKYQGATWLARPLAHTLLHAHGSDLQSGGWDGVIGVPLNGLRIRERGYNQSELLAEELGRELGVGVMRGVVRRVKRTGTQTGLSREERFENMRGAFEPGLGVEGVAGGHVLLVDDVMTTGATVDGCARVLKRAGARSVGVLAVVRGVYY